MKNNKNRVSLREKRQSLKARVLPELRKLVYKYDLAAVQGAVKALYDERKAQKELLAAEKNVAELKRKLN